MRKEAGAGSQASAITVYTLGHSTRSSAEFLELLREYRIALVVDVRRFPGSRRHPQFSRAALEEALRAEGIGYRHEPALGGRRKPLADSPNTAWREAGFRGYADYMETAPFREALERLAALARDRATAILCAEAVPWRCHRQLIADALTARGMEVEHILGAGSARKHVLNPAARILAEGTVRYPGSSGP